MKSTHIYFRIKWVDGDGKVSKLVTMAIPAYDNIDFLKRAKPKIPKPSSVKPIIHAIKSDPNSRVPTIQRHEPKDPPKSDNTLDHTTLPMVKQTSSQIEIKDQKRTVMKKDEDQQSNNYATFDQLTTNNFNKNPLDCKMLKIQFSVEVFLSHFNDLATDTKFLTAGSKGQQTPDSTTNTKQFAQSYQV